jgi:methionyl-tRNA formyltransferase
MEPRQTLRIIFFGTGGDFTMKPLQHVADSHSIIAIVQSAPRGSRSMGFTLWDRLNNLGEALRGHPTPWMASRRLHVPFFYLVKEQSTPSPSGKPNSLSLAHPSYSGDINELRTFMEELNPDIGVVVSFNQLLPESILHIPRLGFINLHPSLLPLYRGPNAWFWHYHEMEQRGGATIHYLDKGEDTGDILKQEDFEIVLGMDPHSFMNETIYLGSRLLLDTLDDLARKELMPGHIKPIVQRNQECPVRARYLKPGENLFYWQKWSIEETYHFLQGVYLWHHPFTRKHGILSRLHWRASGYETTTVPAPGQIRLDWRGAYFAHPQGKVRLRPTWLPHPLAWVRIFLLILFILAVLNIIVMRITQ